MKSTLILSLAATLLGGSAIATPPTAKGAMLNNTDRNFMMTLAKAGAAEIEAGQIAAQRGDKFDRRYGRQMVKEHQVAAAQLMKLATNRDVSLPSAPAPDDEVVIHRLERISKADFDGAYHHFAMMSHKGAVKLFKDEIANGKDPGVKAWAKKTLPTIEKHLHEARDMEMM
jgi:putative membrane protein